MIARVNNTLSVIADAARDPDGVERLRARLKTPPTIFAILERLLELARGDYRPSRVIIRPQLLITLRHEAQGDFAHYVTPDPDEPLCQRFLNLPLTPVSNGETPESGFSILTRN